jgi:hypothetical protein
MRGRVILPLVLGLTAVIAPGTTARAQRRDTTVVDTAGMRPELRPPISPRRAFLSSLIAPGYAQSILGRHRAGTLQLVFEGIALTMIRISAADVREARRMAADSVIVRYVDGDGNPAVRFERTNFPTSLIRSRQAHLEDWIAVLAFNHFFSAADGYVAALLWDLPAEVAVQRGASGTTQLGLRLRW